jgi:hypothetical protein
MIKERACDGVDAELSLFHQLRRQKGLVHLSLLLQFPWMSANDGGDLAVHMLKQRHLHYELEAEDRCMYKQQESN